MINSDSARHRELADRALSVGLPATLRLLAQILAERLGDGRRAEGAAETLVGLGPCVVPTLACVVIRSHPARRVVGAAGVPPGSAQGSRPRRGCG